MSEFIPEIGDLFYATSKQFSRNVFSGIGGDEVIAVKERDRSYDNIVMRCRGVDDHAIVAEACYGNNFYGKNIRFLIKENYKFAPVGPSISAALGLCRETL